MQIFLGVIPFSTFVAFAPIDLISPVSFIENQEWFAG
jgi:hypothetical protein